MARHDPVELTLELLTQTENALLVTDGITECWLPVNKIEWTQRSPPNRRPIIIEATLPEWLAMDRELI